MRRLISMAINCYPAWWRTRYGDEFAEVLAQERAGLSVLTNVIVHGLGVRFLRRRAHSTNGGGLMSLTANRRAGGLALLALAVMLPTAVLVGAAVLKYVVGVAGPFDALEPTMTPIVTHPIGETFFVLAPYVALLLAAVPVSRLRFAWQTGRMSAKLEISAPALNVIVVVASLVLAAFMVLYWVAENL